MTSFFLPNALAAVVAYGAGFLVLFVWTRTVHRRHGAGEPRSAVWTGLLGGALGAICALLMSSVDQMDIFGL